MYELYERVNYAGQERVVLRRDNVDVTSFPPGHIEELFNVLGYWLGERYTAGILAQHQDQVRPARRRVSIV